MSAHGMKPKFSDWDGWQKWRSQWRSLYKRISLDIRFAKKKIKRLQKEGVDTAALQKNLVIQRSMAFKTMNLLEEGKLRWKRILDIRKQIADQMATFPLIVEDCRTVDFHFNKAANEFVDLPMWVIRTKGKTWYVHHVDSDCPWSTYERADNPSTKGMMRFRNCKLSISEKGEATITKVILDNSDKES